MKLLTQNGKRQCTIYSTAMILNTSPQEILKKLGKKDLQEVPVCMDEIIDVFLSRSYCLQYMSIYPGIFDKPVWNTEYCMTRLSGRLKRFDALLKTSTHCYAWSQYDQKVLDPNGYILEIASVLDSIEEVWLKIPLIGAE